MRRDLGPSRCRRIGIGTFDGFNQRRQGAGAVRIEIEGNSVRHRASGAGDRMSLGARLSAESRKT